MQSEQRRVRRRGTVGDRLGYAAAAWSFGYGVLGVVWAVAPAGFPFGRTHDPGGEHTSLLVDVAPATAAPVVAGLGFAGVVVAVAMIRGVHARSVRPLLLGFGGAVAVLTTLVLPDSRPLLALVRLVMLLVGAPFAWPEQLGLADYVPAFLPWPVVNQLLLVLGGVLWAVTTVRYARRGRDACVGCGRSGRGARWTAPDAALRWGRVAVGVAVAVPAFYALTRYAWALGIPLGIEPEVLLFEAVDSPGIWLAGALLATMGVAGAVLTVGLVLPWGEVYPRWIPRLRGRPVRPHSAIVPAAVAAVLITQAGLMDNRRLLLGGLPEDITGPNWATVAPGQLFTLWGLALALATYAYHLRRRGRCPRCHRGETAMYAVPLADPAASGTRD